MGQICTVCAHELSFEINEALVVSKQSNRTIAQQFGVHYSAVQRHRQHIPELLLKASQSLQVFDADRLLEQIEALRLKAMTVLEEAEAANDHRTMLAAIDRASKQLELLAEMTG